MARPFLSLLFLSFLSVPLAAQAQAVFDDVDTNGDGYLSREELDTERMARFLSLDRNGDGMVDRSELMVGPGHGAKGYTAEQTQAVLAAYDHDGDGIITTQEVEEAIARLNIFEGLDVNKDGKLDRAEAEGVLDTRERGATPMRQILDDMAQGKRTSAGFRPVEPVAIADPFDVARRQAVSGDSNAPSVWNHPDHPGVVDVANLPAHASSIPPASAPMPQGRDGYVARMVQPLRAGSLNPYLPGAVPPGPPADAYPLQRAPQEAPPPALPGGANWRAVTLDAQGRPIN